MSSKPVFINHVTHVPVDWANSVSALVYDVFGTATTIDGARQRLGLAGMSHQEVHAVNITGGNINGTDIGIEIPALGRFLRINVSALIPNGPSEVTSKQYVDSAIYAAIEALELQNMAKQRSNAVNITGGSAIFDRLRSRGVPTLNQDVVTLKFFQDTTMRINQAATAMIVDVDNRTVTTPFETREGAMVIFVDQLYQIPDQYEIIAIDKIRFYSELPEGAVVGGFCLRSVV